MEVNIWAVLACGVIAMVLGMVWYGPMMFGRTWMWLMNVEAHDPHELKRLQREAMPLYGIQFVLTLLQAYVLAHFIKAWSEVSGLETALWLYLGFVLPVVVGGCLWNNESGKRKLTRLYITAGYQLLLMIVFGITLSRWG